MSDSVETNIAQTDDSAENGGEGSAFVPPASQEELNAIVESRLARERKKYSDYEDLKAKQTEYEQWKESQLSEQEKAVNAAKEEGRAEATSEFEKRLVSVEVRSQATVLGFHDASDALAAFGDDLPLLDGEPDVEAIKTRLKEIAEKKPYLVAEGVGTPPPGPKRKPKLPAGQKRESEGSGKGKAAAALRQFGKARSR